MVIVMLLHFLKKWWVTSNVFFNLFIYSNIIRTITACRVGNVASTISHDLHDVLNLFSDLFLDNNQNLSFFSEFIFNSHYMFRRSGPGHMLLHTVQKQKVQGRISLSLVKVKVKFTQTEVYKDPLMEICIIFVSEQSPNTSFM